jgi:hypothetical protein
VGEFRRQYLPSLDLGTTHLRSICFLSVLKDGRILQRFGPDTQITSCVSGRLWANGICQCGVVVCTFKVVFRAGWHGLDVGNAHGTCMCRLLVVSALGPGCCPQACSGVAWCSLALLFGSLHSCSL